MDVDVGQKLHGDLEHSVSFAIFTTPAFYIKRKPAGLVPARFRGGQLLSPDWQGDWGAPLAWEDALGQRFTASANLVLKAGHWSPFEAAPPWDFDRVARRNPFFAQVWHNRHDPAETNFYPADCYRDVVESR